MTDVDQTSESWQRGDWMQTYTGLQFYPLSPRPEDIHPFDIAHALAHVCRYGGHVDRFYSVAEHCVLMSYAVRPENALWALLHDAAEAYVGDMVRPLKRNIPDFEQAESLVFQAITWSFGKPWHLKQMPDEVKEADNRILLTERAALMSATRHPWASYVEGLTPLPVDIRGWSPIHAEAQYLERLEELLGE